MDARSTDPDPVTRIQRKHSEGFHDTRLRRLRRGSTLIIISLLLPTVLINVTAFSFPLLGVGFTALPYLRIFWILFAAPLLIGVFLLTTRRSSIKPPGIAAHRGNCLRAISIGYVVVVFCYSVFRILGGVGDPCCLEVEAVLGAVANVLGAGGGGVAWWAHIGGFAVGMALILVFRHKHVPLFGRRGGPWR